MVWGAGREPCAGWRIALRFVFVWLLLTLAFALCVFPFWLARHFGQVGFDQVVFQLQSGVDSLFCADQRLIRRFVRECVVSPALLAVFVSTLLCRSGALVRWGCLAVSWVVGLGLLVVSLNVPAYLTTLAGPDVFATMYVDPASVKLSPPPRYQNLLLIYVESLERTYENAEVFDRNLLAPLSPFEAEGRHFAHLRQTPGTGWTTASLVASQCGVPLKVFGLWNKNRQGEHFEQFLPHATCMGDLLAQHGYRNVFLNGADLQFSGVGRFLSTHGYEERLGRQEWLSAGYRTQDMHTWGLPDDQLMLQAQRRLNELMSAGEPFNLTLLTIDTHGPAGFRSQSCRPRAAVWGFKDTVSCTASLVAGLLAHVREQGWEDRIKVVVVGDHLAMENPLSADLARAKDRSPFNLFWTPGKPGLTGRDIAYYDLFPSILEFLGFDVQGGRLGLGWNALGDDTSFDSDDRWRNLNRMLQNSTRYAKLWGFE